MFVTDGIIKWEPYLKEEPLCIRFPYNEWHKIVSDIHSDSEWADFIEEYSDFITCYILRKCSDNCAIGFLYILNDNPNKHIVSIHGGGWNKSLGSSLLYYRGYICMIEYLLQKGMKVRTTCLINNINALNFIKSVGFVIYKKEEKYYKFWINIKRLHQSKISKYFTKRFA